MSGLMRGALETGRGDGLQRRHESHRLSNSYSRTYGNRASALLYGWCGVRPRKRQGTPSKVALAGRLTECQCWYCIQTKPRWCIARMEVRKGSIRTRSLTFLATPFGPEW